MFCPYHTISNNTWEDSEYFWLTRVQLHEPVNVLIHHALRSPLVLRLAQEEACRSVMRECPSDWAGAPTGRRAPVASFPAPRRQAARVTGPDPPHCAT